MLLQSPNTPSSPVVMRGRGALPTPPQGCPRSWGEDRHPCSPSSGCQGCPKAPAIQGTENRALLPAQCLGTPRLPHQQLKDQLKFALLKVKQGGGEQAEGPAGYPCGQPAP